MELLGKTTRGPSPPAAAKPAEKRSCPRFPFSPAVEALDLKSDMRTMGRLSDISRNGCYVDTINPFAKGAAATLTVTRDDQSFKTQAKVVYSNIGMGMGLLFTTAEPDQLRILGSWLNELSGGRIDEDESNLCLLRETTKNADAELRELRKILGELVAMLNAKNILNDSEAMALLRKLAK
jgi:hypothetical protein